MDISQISFSFTSRLSNKSSEKAKAAEMSQGGSLVGPF
jgi:hypothetical protein